MRRAAALALLAAGAAACASKPVKLDYAPSSHAQAAAAPAPKLFVSASVAPGARLGTVLAIYSDKLKPLKFEPAPEAALEAALKAELAALGIPTVSDRASADGIVTAQLVEAACLFGAGNTGVGFRLFLSDHAGRRYGQALLRGNPGHFDGFSKRRCPLHLNQALANAVARLGEVIAKDGWLEKLAHPGSRPRESGIAYPWTGVGKPPRVVILPVDEAVDGVRQYYNGQPKAPQVPTAAPPFEKALLEQLVALGLEPASRWSEADWFLRSAVKRSRLNFHGMVSGSADLEYAVQLEERSGRVLWQGTLVDASPFSGMITPRGLRDIVARSAAQAASALGDIVKGTVDAPQIAPGAQAAPAAAAGSGPGLGEAARAVDGAVGILGSFVPGLGMVKSATSKAARGAAIVETGQALHGAARAIRTARQAAQPAKPAEPELPDDGNW